MFEVQIFLKNQENKESRKFECTLHLSVLAFNLVMVKTLHLEQSG